MAGGWWCTDGDERDGAVEGVRGVSGVSGPAEQRELHQELEQIQGVEGGRAGRLEPAHRIIVGARVPVDLPTKGGEPKAPM